jgi:hypothetical protein
MKVQCLNQAAWLLPPRDGTLRLLAKQEGQNTNSFVWCRLHEKPAKFPLLNCPEVVPKCLFRFFSLFIIAGRQH